MKVVGASIQEVLLADKQSHLRLLFRGLPQVATRIEMYTDVPYAYHTCWSYCGNVVKHGSTFIYEDRDSMIKAARVEQLFMVMGLFLVSFLEFDSPLVEGDWAVQLKSDDVKSELQILELNTQHATMVHMIRAHGTIFLIKK